MGSSSLDVQCLSCERARSSYSGKPFVPPGGSCNDLFWTCHCGQMWFQGNNYYHLWQPVTPEQADAFRRDLNSPSDY